MRNLLYGDKVFNSLERTIFINLLTANAPIIAQKMKFLMWPNRQFPADFITYTEEIFSGNLHFCAVNHIKTSQAICQINQLTGV